MTSIQVYFMLHIVCILEKINQKIILNTFIPLLSYVWPKGKGLLEVNKSEGPKFELWAFVIYPYIYNFLFNCQYTILKTRIPKNRVCTMIKYVQINQSTLDSSVRNKKVFVLEPQYSSYSIFKSTPTFNHAHLLTQLLLIIKNLNKQSLCCTHVQADKCK